MPIRVSGSPQGPVVQWGAGRSGRWWTSRSVGVEGRGVGRRDQEPATVRTDPVVAPVGPASISPAPRGLAPVMSAAERREILRPGLPRWPVIVVGLHVVEVAGPGIPRAPREDTVLVAQDHQLPHPLGRVVLVDRIGAGQVEDRADAHPGVTDPLLDAGDRRRAALFHL